MTVTCTVILLLHFWHYNHSMLTIKASVRVRNLRPTFVPRQSWNVLTFRPWVERRKWLSLSTSTMPSSSMPLSFRDHPTICGKDFWWAYQIFKYNTASCIIMLYHRSGFDCEILMIVNCEFFWSLQSKESQSIFERITIILYRVDYCSH